MLDPAGDANYTGRKLDDSFERGITYQFAQELKKELESHHPNLQIVLSREPGQSIKPLQNANFANRLDVDCFISIHCYAETAIKPHLYLYTYSDGDNFITKTFDLAFYSYDKAYLLNTQTTNAYANKIATTLNQEQYKQQFECTAIAQLPFKPLVGIKAPAIGIEMGLKSKEDWHNFIVPIATSIESILPTAKTMVRS
jgi:N-acetylmuramoyl-L-alanine amidase